MDLSAFKTNLKSAEVMICRAKSVYDNGKTIAGCMATVATGVCAVAAARTGGADAAVCSAVASYTLTKGFADCISGMGDVIAAKLGYDREWSAVGLGASVSSGQWLGAIDKAIGLACTEVRR